MLKNHLLVAFRSLRRHGGHTAINVAGLAVAMAVCVLIVLYVHDEWSFDRFHEHADRIHRLVRTRSAYTAAPMGPALATEMAGVERATRVELFPDVPVHRGEDQSYTEDVYAADSSFFEIFTFPFLQGDPTTALARPDGLVLTASAARKYFGDADPMGRTLIVEDDEPVSLTVTGVIADVPANAHFRFDLLASFKLVEQASNRLDNWTTNWLFTYLLLKEGTTAEALTARLPGFFERHTGEAWDHFVIQPLLDVHLHSAHFQFDIAPQGNVVYVYLFSVVALLLLLIACINFMNLATARAAGRAREVGVRKVLGAGRGQLIRQFLGESFLTALAALLIAAGLVVLSLPVFRTITEKDLALGAGTLGFLAAVFLGITVLVGLLAGSYPALYLSAFRPVVALKGGRAGEGRSGFLRKGLVVFQFTISIGLIVGTLVVARQLDYVKNARLGFDKEQVVVLPLGNVAAERYEAITNEVGRHPGVRSVSASGNVPGHGVSDYYYEPEGLTGGAEDRLSWDTYFVDADFVETLGLEIVDGRAFSGERETDEQAFLLNESAVADARAAVGEDWASPVGKQVAFYVPGADGWRELKSGTVVGVVKDFHYRSLHEAIGPLALQILPEAFSDLLVKVSTDDLSGTLAFLEQQWRAHGPAVPFTYYFLDDDFDRLYRAEERVGTLFGVFALLTIGIACLGLFGLSAFMAERRTKELGIRKVLGASVSGLVLLLTSEFTRLVGLAFLVAAPAAYVVMQRWLSGFVYHVEISGWIFLWAGLAALGVAFLAVSYHTVRAARADPVQSLRYE